jgi:hypothetical protein
VEPLDVATLLGPSEQWFTRLDLPKPLLAEICRINRKPLSGNVFTIGTYGKVGVTKGSFDLVAALARIAKDRKKFAFLSLSCGRRETLQAYYEAIVQSRDLAQRTWILPPIGPWRIPSFLHRCDAVCFLEREFPIAFHGPLIPREVFSSGACLVCSAEVANKPLYGKNIVDDRNAVIIENPKDHDLLAKRLKALIHDRDRARSIAVQGRALASFWDEDLVPFEVAVRSFAAQIQHFVRRTPRIRSPKTQSHVIAPRA